MLKVIVNLCIAAIGVQSDPYQFNQTDLGYLCKERSRLLIKKEWGKQTPDDDEMLNIIEGELRFRRDTGHEWFCRE